MGVFAQKQELSFGAGTMSRPAFKTLHPFIRVYGDAGDDPSVAPVFHLSFSRFVLPRWEIGIALIYEHQSHDFSIMPDEGKHRIYQEAYFTGLFFAHYHWLQKSILEIYSGLDLGWNLLKQDDERDDFSRNPRTHSIRSALAYQLTPIGLRIGKRLAGYAELGYGYKGFALCGISYRF